MLKAFAHLNRKPKANKNAPVLYIDELKYIKAQE